MQVEKNDVDIRKLFNWGKVFELLDENSKPIATLFMRIVGDADINKARVYALRRSAELRAKLKNKKSDEHLAFIPDKSDLTKSQLKNLIVLLSTREISQRSIREVKLPIPVPPRSSEGLEAMEEFQKEVDEYTKKLDEKRIEFTKKELKRLENSLTNRSKDDLYKQYVTILINELCEQEATEAFKDAVTFYGTYKDAEFTEHYFNSLDDFINLPSYLKEQFITAYNSLEIGGEELKKLREVTQ